MRPRRLSMTAFGPFAKQEVICFDDLGDDPLFLIHGPTGAGKTSILDAICFALTGVRYASVPGWDDRRQARHQEDHLHQERGGRRFDPDRAGDQQGHGDVAQDHRRLR